MRYAIVSDIHANLQAWNAVHADLTAQGAERIICLGDVVGYGPRPADTLAALYENVDMFVLGNHDAVVADLLDPAGFNPDAQRMIAWTCEQLHERATRFFRRVPFTLVGDGFRCVHGAAVRPERFYYVNGEKVARASWKHSPEPLVFVGHTHKAAIHRLNREGDYRACRPKDFRCQNGWRYAVNVGSVGMPRDGDFRASYCIFDDSAREVSFRKVAFDLDAFRQDVTSRIGRSHQSELILSWFEDQRHQPVRRSIDFSPQASRGAQETVPAQEISNLRGRARRWQGLAAAAVAALVVTGSIFGLVTVRAPHQVVLGSDAGAMLTLARVPSDAGMRMISGSGAPSGQPPPGWQFKLDYEQKQSALLTPEGLRLKSESTDHAIEVRFPTIALADSRKVQVQVQGRKLADCSGALPMLLIDYIGADGRESLQAKTKPLVEADEQLSTQYTFRVRQDVRAIRPRLRGAFSGDILISDLIITPRPEARESGDDLPDRHIGKHDG